MKRTEAIKNVLVMIEGGGDYEEMYNRANKALDEGKIPRFTKYEKELLAYKYECTMLTEEEVESLEIVTGLKDWLKEERIY